MGKFKKVSTVLSIMLAFVMLFSYNMSLSANASAYTSTGLKDDTLYYILNADNNELLAPASPNSNDISNVITYSRSWITRTQWLIDKQSDGTYKLWSLGGNGKIMRAYSVGSELEVEYDENDSSVKFDICRINSGDNTGKYYIKNGNNYVSLVDDNTIRLKSFTSDTLGDGACWSFIAVNKRDAEFHCFNYNNMNTFTHTNAFISNFDSYGYGTYRENNYNYPQSTPQLLTYDDVFIFAGYGATASIDYYTLEGYLIGTVTVNNVTGQGRNNAYYINDLEEDDLCLSRCIIYLGSYTGDSYGGYNLVDVTYEKGAHYVLGIKGIMTQEQINDWIQGFLASINWGANINDAVIDANDAAEILNDVIYARGDGNQYLKF